MNGDLTGMTFFTCVLLIVVTAIRASLRKRAMDYDHTERTYALEKGSQVLNGMTSHLEQVDKNHIRNPYLIPIILMCVGFALVLAQVIMWDFDNIAIGLVVMAAGGGWMMGLKFGTKQEPPAPPVFPADTVTR